MSEALEHALRQSEAQRQQLLRDVAAHHVTEGRLLEQGERFRTTLASIGDAVIATDVDTRITCMNAVAEALTGWTAADARDHPLDAVFRIVHETTRSAEERPATRALHDGDIVALATDTVLIASDGTERPVDGCAAPIRLTDGEIVGCVLVFRDITERRRVEATQRAAQVELATTLDSITDGFVRFDRNWRVVGLNAEAERMIQRPRSDTVGNILWELWPATVGSRLDAECRRAVADQVTVEFEDYFEPLGQWYAIKGYPTPDGGLAVHCRDITTSKRAEAALRERTAILAAVTDGSSDPIFVKDRDGRMLFANPATLRILGRSEAEVLGKTDAEFHPPADEVEALQTNDRRIMASGVGETVEEIVTGPAGTGTYLSTKTPMRDGAGAVIGIIGVTRDITERKQAEEELRASEARFRALATASSDVIFRMSPDWSEMRPLDGRGVFASTEAESRTWQEDYVHPEDQPTFMDCIHGAIRTKSIVESEHRSRRVDGTWGWTCVRAVPMLDAHGNIIEWFGTVTDVSARKEAEVALRESTALLQAISDATGDVIFAKDREGRMTYANAATLAVIGKPLHDVLGKTCEELVDYASAARQVMTDDQRIMDSGISEEIEEQFPLPDGTNRVWLSRKAPHRDVEGRVIGLLGVSRDITDRARIQLQLVQAEKLQAVGRLAGGIAHDFNNLLMVITGNLELMRDQLRDRLPDDSIELSEVLGAADRARILVEHLLTFSRQRPVAYASVDVRALIAATTGLLQRTLGKEITIVSDVSSYEDLIVDGDAAVMEQMLLNLAFNARDAITSLLCDAGRQGGVVTFAARAVTMDHAEALRWAPLVAGRCIEIVVSDTGTGMTDDVRANALEPFFTTKAVGEGTGLGLASVYGTVTNLHGAMQLESAVPHGAVVRLRFPVGTLAVGADTPSLPRATGPVPQRALLCVEDDDAVRRVMLRMLRNAGHHVVEACNGQDALELARTMGEELAGVISDVRMPGMSGINMVRALRTVRPDIPVLFVSGDADATWIDEFGANTALLTKPCAPSRLVAALEQVLSDRTTSR